MRVRERAAVAMVSRGVAGSKDIIEVGAGGGVICQGECGGGGGLLRCPSLSPGNRSAYPPPLYCLHLLSDSFPHFSASVSFSVPLSILVTHSATTHFSVAEEKKRNAGH